VSATPHSAQAISLQAGRVSGVTEQWTSVSVTQAFTTPIVTAGPLSFADAQPAGVRVRNVSGSGFQVRAQEWDSQDGVHGAEQLSYVVMERGRYLLGNGKVVLADSTSVGGGSFQSKTFSQPFTTIPLLLATVVTQNEAEAVTVQLRNVSTTGFQIRLWEQEANSQAHAAETVHYLAWEPGVGTLNGFAFEVGTIGVNNVFATLWFGSPFADVPLLLAGSQTTVGTEAYSIRQRNITRARVEMSLQEDDSFDAESSHATETVAYLLLGTPGPPGVGMDATLVAMGDSITFGIGDDITTDNYPVGILPPGGYPPILTTRVNDQLGKDILISNEGIPGDRSAEGAGDVANLVGAYAQAQYFLLLYGANDAGFNVRSGVGLSPGQSGYLGSFKGNMQQIITSIRTAGKTPILAKVLYQTNPSKDPLIQQYNQVIEELASQNNLRTIPRPDFYTFFKNHPSLLPDGLHPNGTGYQSMATLWYDAISGLLQ
jgi:lysophospholipase L1-like esterase